MTKTLDQVERMKDKAVRFVRDVIGDHERADEIEVESPEDYAERKGLRIIRNPHKRRNSMPHQSRTELLERIEELESENQELQDKLTAIADVLDDANDDNEDNDDD